MDILAGIIFAGAGIIAAFLILNNKLDTIMASQAELAAELSAKTAQIRKAIDEIVSKIAALEEAVRNSPATPELTAAVAALSVAVQSADDVVPDAPPA